MKTRIYICGAQSVGKTTLCRELGKHLGYAVVPEAARDIMNSDKVEFSKIALDIQARNAFQLKVGREHLRRHLDAVHRIKQQYPRADNGIEGAIFDRGVDYLVYGAGFSTVGNEQLSWPETDHYFTFLKGEPSLVILLEPHESLMKQDDVRAGLSMKSAYEVTFGIKTLLELFGIPYIHVTTSDTLERVKLIASIAQVK